MQKRQKGCVINQTNFVILIENKMQVQKEVTIKVESRTFEYKKEQNYSNYLHYLVYKKKQK